MHYFAFALEMKEPGINIISHDNLCQLPVTKVAIRQFNKRIIDHTNRNTTNILVTNYDFGFDLKM